MSKSSDRSRPNRRVPQRSHGERRVAALLDSAEAVIAQHGYGGATMTMIAEHAQTSIGTVYQYFSDKNAVVHALGARYAEEMAALWPPLAEHVKGLELEPFANALIQALVLFMTTRPAYVQLQEVPKRYKRDGRTRNRLRESFAALLLERGPDLTPDEASLITTVSLRIVMSLAQEYGYVQQGDREKLVSEFTCALIAYLKQAL